jgi:hypothetical protein
MKYAQFNESGVLIARYDSAVGPAPSDAIQITDEIFARTIAEVDGIWKLVNGVVTKTPLAPVSDEQKDAAWNDAVDAQLMAADLKIIRALTEGDTARINAHKAAQATLRATRR